MKRTTAGGLVSVLVLMACSAHAAVFEVAANDEGTLTDLTVSAYTGASVAAGGTLYLDLSAAPPFAITGAGRVVKRNSASWTMSVASPDFTGDWEIIGGVVTTTAAGMFGKANKNYSLVVTNGATWSITDENGGIGARTLKLGGTGVDGRGALEIDGPKNFKWGSFLRYITLVDDALVIIKKGYFLDQYSGLLDLGGHKMTVKGGGQYQLYGCTISDSGEVAVEGTSAGTTEFWIRSNSHSNYVVLVDSENASFSLNGYAMIRFYNNTRPFSRPLNVRGLNNTLYHAEQYAFSPAELGMEHIVWGGPITFVESESVLTVSHEGCAKGDYGCAMALTGKISGDGSLITRCAKGCDRIYLANPANDYTGVTTNASGTLVLASPGAVPDAAKFTRSGGTVLFGTGANGWTPSEVLAFVNAAAGVDTATIRFTGDNVATNETPVVSIAGDTAALSGNGLAQVGERPVVFTGGATESAPLDFTWTSGYGILSGTSPYYAYRVNVAIPSDSSTTALTLDGADITVAPYGYVVSGYGTSSRYYNRLIITNSLVRAADLALKDTFNTTDTNYATPSNSLVVGKAGRGLLEIEAGAVISNRLQVGMHGAHVWDDNSFGGVRQRGGTLVAVDPNNGVLKGNAIGVGQSAGGYYDLQGGELISHGTFSLGMGGVGTMQMSGGSFVVTNVLDSATKGYFYMGAFNGGKAALRVSGGRFEYYGGPTIWVGYGSTSKLLCTLTVDGADAVCDLHNANLCSGYACTGGAYHFNFNGGVFRAATIQRHTNKNNHTNNLLTVSFNGGTFKAASGGALFSSDSAIRPNEVVVYSGGATFDTDGNNCWLYNPVKGAYGKGISSITLAKPIAHVTSPLVEITGVGTGATAFAHYDWDTHTIDRIDVTCPGSGYTEGTTTARLLQTRDGAAATLDATAFTLVDNANTGSFTKKGEGTLTLEATNTWGGATVLAGGILKCGCDGAIPQGTTVVLAGGTLDMNGKKMLNGDALPTSWKVDADTAKALGGTIPYAGAIAFPEGSTLEVANAAEMDEDDANLTLLSATGGVTGEPSIVGAIDADWHVIRTAKGFKLCRRCGIMMIIR